MTREERGEEKEKIIKNEQKKPDEQKRNEEVKRRRINAEDFTNKISRENFEEKKNPRIWR
jgi:hypothetical protein